MTVFNHYKIIYIALRLVVCFGNVLAFVVLIRSNRHVRRSPRHHESPLEPYPGHSVSLAARGSRPNDRSAWASRHDPRRDRPRSLRSRAAGRPRPPARGSARPCQAFVAKAMLGIPTTSALIERLAVDKSLRRILGWERRWQVPPTTPPPFMTTAA